MGLTLNNIKRLLKCSKHRLMKSKYRILKICVGYCYVFISYIAIIYSFSYYIRSASKPIGNFILIIDTSIYLIMYMAINHLVIQRIICKKTLWIIELILIITLCVIWWSDVRYENRNTTPPSELFLLPSFIV